MEKTKSTPHKKHVKKISLFILMLINTLSFHCYPQVAEIDNHVGTNHLIDSKILEENRQVQVYLPSGYSVTDKNYPVLYLLDGQRFFLYAVSLLESFRQYNLTPEFIVVGITNSYPQRFGHFSSGKDRFIGFIKDELVPFIEHNYRSEDNRLFFGWEYAGGLGFHLLVNEPSLFNGYLLASPFPIKDKVHALDSVAVLNKALYFSVSPDEYEVNHGVDRLDSLLSTNNIEGLDWSYMKLSNEEHRSTAYPTLYHGLRKYFKYYPELQVDNLSKFIEVGGLNYAYNYSKERSRQYGFEPELSAWSKFTIIRSAMRAENYDYFNTYVNALKLNEFIHEVRSGRISDIAGFYEKNNNYNQAIEIYKALLEKHPDSHQLLSKIGNAYKALDNHVEAKKYFQRAQNESKKGQ